MDQNQSPEQIYAELSRFIIGQTQAKRTMAVALRNRWRKQQLTKIEQAVIRPQHVLLVGPSGSGKTAIGKQLAKLSHSPFVKAEATQFTQVGYRGRTVTEIVEEIVDQAMAMLEENSGKTPDQRNARSGMSYSGVGNFSEEMSAITHQLMQAYQERYEQARIAAQPQIKEAMSKLADLLEFNDAMKALHEAVMFNRLDTFTFPEATPEQRAQMEAQLETTALDKQSIYVPKVHRKPESVGFKREMERMMKGCLGAIVKLNEETLGQGPDVDKFRAAAVEGQRHLTSQKRITVGRLRNLWSDSIIQDILSTIPHPTSSPSLIQQMYPATSAESESESATPEKVSPLATRAPTPKNAVAYAEQHGIIFIDEIDKLIGKGTENSDATLAGVQRDLLPLLDGCIVGTKYGNVNTTNMLFICSGAFQLHKPEELMVELQGRLPIRVQLEALSVEDFVNILRMKEENVLDQYVNMMRVDGVDLVIEDEAVVAIAKAAFSLNINQGNYGARRLYACVERSLADITFLSAPKERIKITITREFIENQLGKH